ncbi:MAG TPA: ABC transporter permease [Bauldia sp.]|nr:ABC transporter permease [Bauldia sp.]
MDTTETGRSGVPRWSGAAASLTQSGGGPARLLRQVLVSQYFVLYLTIAYFAVAAVFLPDLVTARNISNQLSNVWPLFAVAIGQTLVIIIMGIDLSQGAIMGFVSVAGAVVMATAADPNLLGSSPLWGTLLTESGGFLSGSAWSVAVGVAAMLATGCLIGALNGFFIAGFNMAAFTVTLVSLMLFGAAGIWLTQSQNVVNLPPGFLRLGSGDLISFYFGEKVEATIKRRDILSFITYPMVIALALGLVAEITLRKTILGRHIYAVGMNRAAAAISGVPIKRVVVLVFAFSGFCAAVAAILYSARLGGGRPTIGSGTALLDIIGATVIGGTSLSGGKGKVVWTLIGVVFFVLLGNTLNYMGLSAFYIDVVKGGIILLAAALDVTRTRLSASEAG